MLILNSWGFQLLRIIDTMKGRLGSRLLYEMGQQKQPKPNEQIHNSFGP